MSIRARLQMYYDMFALWAVGYLVKRMSLDVQKVYVQAVIGAAEQAKWIQVVSMPQVPQEIIEEIERMQRYESN